MSFSQVKTQQIAQRKGLGEADQVQMTPGEIKRGRRRDQDQGLVSLKCLKTQGKIKIKA